MSQDMLVSLVSDFILSIFNFFFPEALLLVLLFKKNLQKELIIQS